MLRLISILVLQLKQAPEDAPWVHNPAQELRLTPQQLRKIRRHLFGDAAVGLGKAAAGLSDRLSDFELAQLLICSTGECATAHSDRRHARPRLAWTGHQWSTG